MATVYMDNVLCCILVCLCTVYTSVGVCTQSNMHLCSPVCRVCVCVVPYTLYLLPHISVCCSVMAATVFLSSAPANFSQKSTPGVVLLPDATSHSSTGTSSALKISKSSAIELSAIFCNYIGGSPIVT